jgi:predicted nucleic acid-binding protein
MASETPRSRVFVDSTVLFLACHSASGYARDLILAAVRGELDLFLSDYVLIETERNLLKKSPDAHAKLLEFMALLPNRVNPDRDEVVRVAQIIKAKDAPIVAGAIVAQAILVTYDVKDLLSQRDQILTSFGIHVRTPQEVLTTPPSEPPE